MTTQRTCWYGLPHVSWRLSRPHSFWVDEFGPLQVDQISEDQVDQAINRLVIRGKLKGGTGQDRGQPTGQPLSGSTINRFVSTLAGLFKYARRLRVLPRSHVPPTRGFEKAPEPVDPDKYFRPEEVERLLAVARVVDRRWKKLPALIVLGFHTGIRIGNLKGLKWEDIDFDAKTASIAITKNGRPHVTAADSCIEELRKLPKAEHVTRLGYRSEKPFNHRVLLHSHQSWLRRSNVPLASTWMRICTS